MSSVRAHIIGRRAGKTLIACLIAAASNTWLDVQAETATATATAVKPGKPSMIQTSEPAKPSSYNANSLRRLDFTVRGKSCAVCLMGIQRKFKAMPGVVKAAVMLKRPYGAAVIYDSSKVTKEELLKKAREQDKEVKIEQPVDSPIKKIPNIFIPLYGIPKSPTMDIESERQK